MDFFGGLRGIVVAPSLKTVGSTMIESTMGYKLEPLVGYHGVLLGELGLGPSDPA